MGRHQSEVREPGAAVGVDEDVAGAQSAMGEADRVGVVQRGGDVDEHLGAVECVQLLQAPCEIRGLEGDGGPREALPEPTLVPHRQHAPLRDGALLVEGVVEALDHDGLGAEVGVEDLEGDRLLPPQVRGPPGGTQAAFAQDLVEAVGIGHDLARLQCWTRAAGGDGFLIGRGTFGVVGLLVPPLPDGLERCGSGHPLPPAAL